MPATKDEVEQFRSPLEFISWFESLLDAINADTTNKRNVYLRLHDGYYKEIYGEMLPLWRLLKWKTSEWDGVLLRNVLGDQNFDVELRNHHHLDFLEIASADFDEEEHFRGRHLYNNGEVCWTAPILRDKNQRMVGIDTENQWASHDDVINRRLEMVRDRLEKKSAKNYPDHIGLVVFVEEPRGSTEGNRAGWLDEDRIKYAALVEEMRNRWENTFECIFLVGAAGELFVEAVKSSVVGC